MNPPAAIDTLFNRIARREALPADPVVDFDTALPPLEFQVEARFHRNTSFRFLAPAASSNFPSPLGVGVEADTMYGSARTSGRVQRCGLTRPRRQQPRLGDRAQHLRARTAATSRLAIRREADYGRRARAGPSKVFIFAANRRPRGPGFPPGFLYCPRPVPAAYW